MRGGGARHGNGVSFAHRAAIPSHRLPHGAAQCQGASIHAGPRGERRRKLRHMMAEVTARGEIRRLPIFIAAITGNRGERRLRVGNGAAIVVVEREGEQFRRIGYMRRLPKARADNDAGHAGLIEYPLAGHGGNRNAVRGGHGVRGAQHALKRRPATGGANEPTILHLRPGAQRVPVGFGRAEPAFTEKSAQQRAVAEETNAVRQRVRGELGGEAGVEQRSTDLIARNANTAGHGHPQVRGVHVREADCANAAGVAFGFQIPQCIEPARIGEGPRVKLQYIDAVGAQSSTGAIDCRAHIGLRDRAGLGHPLGEALHRRVGAQLLAEDARYVFGRTVMIGHVERRKAVLDVLGHRVRGRVAIKNASIALHVGQLPETGQHTGDFETRRERVTGDRRHRCRQWGVQGTGYLGGSTAVIARRSPPPRCVGHATKFGRALWRRHCGFVNSRPPRKARTPRAVSLSSSKASGRPYCRMRSCISGASSSHG